MNSELENNEQLVRQEKEIKVLLDLNRNINSKLEKLKDNEAKFIEINTTKDEQITNINLENEQLNSKLKILETEKDNIQHKYNHLLNNNIETKTVENEKEIKWKMEPQITKELKIGSKQDSKTIDES